jgi:hypothetical protein
MTETLPPLPEPKIATAWLRYSEGEKPCSAYTADQMNAHYLKGYNDARAATEAHEARKVPQSISEGWDIERDGKDLLVCFNDHEKGEKCEYVRYSPAPQTVPAVLEGKP